LARRLIPRAAAVLLALILAGCGGLAKPSPELFPSPPGNAVTFWGHACLYLDVDGIGIVTDPVFERVTILRFRRIPAPPPETYAGTRIVLVSHAHPDHLSPSTLETFPEDVVVLCPEPSAGLARKSGREIRVMRPGDEYAFPGGRIVAVAAKHPGGRFSVSASTDGTALGYVIETRHGKIYYAGDTNLFDGVREVGRVHRPRVTLLNINGHLHALDAVRAAWATGSSVVIPAHWGAYGYLGLPAAKEPRDVEDLREALGGRLVELGIGESWSLEVTVP